MYPTWTELDDEDSDAIQYLRLNELRDHINAKFFRAQKWVLSLYSGTVVSVASV